MTTPETKQLPYALPNGWVIRWTPYSDNHVAFVHYEHHVPKYRIDRVGLGDNYELWTHGKVTKDKVIFNDLTWEDLMVILNQLILLNHPHDYGG